jgi:hypothetical protein
MSSFAPWYPPIMDRCVFGVEKNTSLSPGQLDTEEEESVALMVDPVGREKTCQPSIVGPVAESSAKSKKSVAFAVDPTAKPSSFESAKNKIPKPSGERGKPRRGGYSLAEQLAWNAKDYKEAQVLQCFRHITAGDLLVIKLHLLRHSSKAQSKKSWTLVNHLPLKTKKFWKKSQLKLT